MSSKTNTIYGLLTRSAEKYPEHILFKDSTGEVYSYARTLQTVDRLSRGLLSDGFGNQDKIGLMGVQNSSSWCISYLAIIKIGAVVVPLDPNLKEKELLNLLTDCRATGIITDSHNSPLLENFIRELQFLRKVYLFNQAPVKGLDTLEDLLHKGERQPDCQQQENPDSLSILIYTSGTTGKPKGVMLSQTNIISDLEAIQKRLVFENNDVALSILPLHHTFECTCGFLNSMSLGLKIVFARSFKSNELLEDIRNNKISFMCGVPLLYEKMYLSFKRKIDNSPFLQNVIFKLFFRLSGWAQKRSMSWGLPLFKPLRKKAGLDSLRMLISGGAALPFKVSQFFNTIGIPMLQGYGLTETSPVISVNSLKDNKFDSIGKPLDSVKVNIDKPDKAGNGEIIVKGPMVMLGYYNDKYETEKVIRNNWFHTGDVGHIDKNGFLYVTGRSKNVIVSPAGKNIHPEEIEVLLNESPFISESLVFGRNHDSSNSEEVAALIVPDYDFILTSDKKMSLADNSDGIEKLLKKEINAICSGLADYKRIKRYFIHNRELPKTTSRKIKRSIKIDSFGNITDMK